MGKIYKNSVFYNYALIVYMKIKLHNMSRNRKLQDYQLFSLREVKFQ